MNPDLEPSPWVRRYAEHVPREGAVLDVACGSGRHAMFLAGLGCQVTAIDIDTGTIEALTQEAGMAHSINILTSDLECGDWPFETGTFDAVIVVNYLHRAHFELLAGSLARGGLLLFDTFAVGNERIGRPRNPDYLLRPGELLREFGPDLDIIAYDHGQLENSVRQRLCAVRR
ncbi:MAG: class I SAM-dependent methyltransferase [Gammaproteobacteria bacterium]